MFKSAQRELSRRMGQGYDKALERKEWVLGHGRVQWLVGDREQECGRLGQGHGKEQWWVEGGKELGLGGTGLG